MSLFINLEVPKSASASILITAQPQLILLQYRKGESFCDKY